MPDPREPAALLTHCTRCQRLLFGSARTCLVHGDQLDVGNRAPAVETVADQIHQRAGGGTRRPR
jgi:hypothetical protein